jgi:hypothetical protein
VRDACPAFSGKTYLDWKLDDPAGQGADAVRPIRDEIESRVGGLLADLGVKPGARQARTDALRKRLRTSPARKWRRSHKMRLTI